MSLGSFKNAIKKMFFTNLIYLIYMYKQYLALYKLKYLICNKTKSNQTTKGWPSTS